MNQMPLAIDAHQGDATVQLTSTAGFSVGQYVLIDENGELEFITDNAFGPSKGVFGQVWGSADHRLTYNVHNPMQHDDEASCPPHKVGAACTGVPSLPCYEGWNNTDCDYYISDIREITAIGAGPCPGVACTLTFDEPLTISYRVANAAHVSGFVNGWESEAGLENMTLQNGSFGEVQMGLCAYCWVKNVECDDFIIGCIMIGAGYHDQLEEIYAHYNGYPFIGGGGYNFDFDAGTSDLLFWDSIGIEGEKMEVERRAGGGNVIAYNYFDKDYCADGGCGDQGGNGFDEVEDGVNGSHFMGSHHTLFEGNWGFNGDSDNTWGSDPYHTFFRNDFTGYRSKFTDYVHGTTIDDINNIPGGNGPLRALGADFGVYWHSAIGNVLGTPGHTTAVNGWKYIVYGCGQNATVDSSPAIFMLGEGCNYTGGNNADLEVSGVLTLGSLTNNLYNHCADATGDPCPELVDGNYDYYNNAQIWASGDTTHTLPNSLFLTSAPPWWPVSGYAWPWVTPSNAMTQVQSGPTTANCTANVGGPCSGLPAKARMDNGTPFTQP